MTTKKTATKKRSGKKRNDGKDLERLAMMLETFGLPKPYQIKRRELHYDEDGDLIGELDVVILAEWGTTTWRIVIEARDRPSDGPAPREWIRALVTRKEEFQIDKMFAVSSTGFARGARKLAGRKNIVLRTVRDFRPDEITRAIPLNAPGVTRSGHFTAVKIGISDPNYPKGEPPRVFSIDCRDKVIHVLATGERIHLIDLWNQVIKDGPYFDGLVLDGEKRKQLVTVPPEFLTGYRIEYEGKEYAVDLLEFDAEFFITRFTMKLKSVKGHFNENGEKLAEIMEWSDPATGDSMIFIGYLKKPEPPKDQSSKIASTVSPV